ncbi:hypothetical protein Vqi01_50360 [Micromonospora qiuiae]|uniref:Hydantoin racemase n=2 Tax=Micromonospora qiuiae TaxID=502268 RepID=A0ABQ4JK08_9ACTN|nr:hypothetical protein Vqi01_50360 [Micromonospora qiuiae]
MQSAIRIRPHSVRGGRMADLKHLAMLNSDGKALPPLRDPAGVKTALVDLRARVLARTPYDRLLTELITLDAAERAVTRGCDALFIDTFGDYAIDAVRAAVDVPVVGAGEASLAAASAYGRFTIVTVWPESMGFIYDERLRTCPGGESCVRVNHFSAERELDRVGSSQGIKARMLRHEPGLIDDLGQACRQAAIADEAAAVLLGCTCMSPIAAAIQDRCDVPVLDPSALGQQAAFNALLQGGPPSARPRTARRGQAHDLVDLWLRHDTAATESDACDVCVIGEYA